MPGQLEHPPAGLSACSGYDWLVSLFKDLIGFRGFMGVQGIHGIQGRVVGRNT